MQHSSQSSDRMTDNEAQEVLKLLEERRQRRESLAGQPTLTDVAQLANASVHDVADALREVRYQNLPVISVERPKKKFNPAFLAAAVVVLLLFGATFSLVRGQRETPQQASTMEVAKTSIAPSANAGQAVQVQDVAAAPAPSGVASTR